MTRFIVSSLVATVVLGAICLFSFIFFIEFDAFQWGPLKTLWFNKLNGKPVLPPYNLHLRSSSEGAWQIFILCLGLITPFLELLTWVSLPPCPPRLASLGLRCRQRLGLLPRRKPTKYVTDGVPASFAANDEPKPHPFSWRGILASMHLTSPASAFFLLVWVAMNILAWMIPYGHRYLWLINPNNKKLDGDVVKGGINTYGAKVANSLGRTAGWATAMNMALTFIPVDRSSSWLAAFNMTFEEANIMHRLFGWAAFGWTLLHTVFQQAAFASVSHEAWKNMFLYLGPWYSGHSTDSTAAGLGGLIFIVVFLTSLGPVRKWCYNLFRLSHLLIIVMLPLLIMHKPFLFFWMEYGFLLYAADLAQRLFINSVGTTATLTAVAEPGDAVTRVTLTLNSRHMKPDASWNSKVLYLRIGRLSFWESHPFSISSVDGNTLTMHVGAVGNWTRKVHDLALTGGAEGVQVPVRVEGPYGCDLEPELERADAVVLMGAGMGITPVISLAQRLAGRNEVKGKPAAPVHVWWVMRNATLAASLPMGLLQRLASTAGFHVRLFVTSPSPATPNVAAEGESALMSAKHVPLLRSASSGELAANDANVKIDLADYRPTPYSPQPFHAFLRRFIPRAIITWISTMAIISGWLIACQIVYQNSGRYTETSPAVQAMAASYKSATLTNVYLSSLTPPLPFGSPLPAGADPAAIAQQPWPKAQPTFGKLVTGIQEKKLFGHRARCISCNANTNPDLFQYGMNGFHCCGTRVPLARTFIHVLFPPFFAFVIATFAALLCKHLLARYWPLHDDNGTAYSSSPRSSQASGSPATTAAATAVAGKEGYEPTTTGKGMSSGAGMVEWRRGRPDFATELSEVAAGMEEQGYGKVMAVYCCGGAGIRTALRGGVHGAELPHNGVTVHLREFHLRD